MFGGEPTRDSLLRHVRQHPAGAGRRPHRADDRSGRGRTHAGRNPALGTKAHTEPRASDTPHRSHAGVPGGPGTGLPSPVRGGSRSGTCCGSDAGAPGGHRHGRPDARLPPLPRDRRRPGPVLPLLRCSAWSDPRRHPSGWIWGRTARRPSPPPAALGRPARRSLLAAARPRGVPVPNARLTRGGRATRRRRSRSSGTGAWSRRARGATPTGWGGPRASLRLCSHERGRDANDSRVSRFTASLRSGRAHHEGRE